MKTVFDLGMGMGADTEYYLSKGFRVIGVEPHPERAATVKQRFRLAITHGQLHVIAGAVSESDGESQLFVSADKVPHVSLNKDFAGATWNGENITVPTYSILSLIKQYGQPYFLKVDIEGMDKVAILPLTPDIAPEYISFEADGSALEIMAHMKALGFGKFKIMHQVSHREMSRVDRLPARIDAKLRRTFNIPEPKFVRRHGRVFRIGSSGPMPECSDGPWHNYEKAVSMWSNHMKSPVCGGWWDIQGRKG